MQCQDIQMKEDVLSLNEGRPTIADTYRSFVTKVIKEKNIMQKGCSKLFY